MGHVATEFLFQRRRIIRINLAHSVHVRPRHRHTTVQQIFCAQLGVHVDRNTVGSHWRKRSLQLFRDIIILMRDTGMRNERELYRMRIEYLALQTD